MNSEQIKAVLLSGDFAPVPAKFAYDYILALEAERDAGRSPHIEQVYTVDASKEAFAAVDALNAARARVDSFKPPAAPGEGEKA